MTEEQMDRMIEIRNAYKAGDITEQEHLDLIDVEVFGNSPVEKTISIKETESGFMTMRSVPMQPGELYEPEEYETTPLTDEEVEKLDSYDKLSGYSDETNDGGTITLEQISNHYLEMSISGFYQFDIDCDDNKQDEYFVQVDGDDNSKFSIWMDIYKANNPDEDLEWFFGDTLEEPMECYYWYERNEDGSQSEDSKKFYEFVSKYCELEEGDGC